MSTTDSIYRRVIRRETHSPRAGLAIFLAVVPVLILAWVGTESVLALFSLSALLVAPADALKAVLGLPNQVTAPALIAAGAVGAVIGFIVLLFAFLPGRRARHVGTTDRTAVVVDNRVIASSLARSVSYAGNIDPDQVRVTIGHHTALVTVQPTSGFSIDRAEILDTVRAELSEFNLTPALRPKIVIEQKGVVGA